MLHRMATLFLSLIIVAPALSAGEPLPLTHAERTGFRETGSYEQALDFIRQLQRRSPLIRLEPFGRTGRGRTLYAAVLSDRGCFTPQLAHAGNRPVVLVSCGIHSGEICGKEASLMLMRQLVDNGLDGLLDRITLLVVPVFNVDGHEAVSPWNRLNQNGPAGGMGHRANALGHDLNRDFMKLETPEARAWIGELFNRWRPHLTIDMHTTDGWDHRYALTYLYDRHPLLPPVLEQTVAGIVERAAPIMREAGTPIQVYGSVDKLHPEKGYTIWPPYPRLCTSYVATRGRLALLAEAHAHKPFETRVRTAHNFLRTVLADVAARGAEMVSAVEQAEATLIARGATVDPADRVALEMQSGDGDGTITLETFELTAAVDPRTGLQRITYSDTPLDHTVPLRDRITVSRSVTRPAAYLVPAEYRRLVVDHLLLHGARVERASEPFTVEVERRRIEALTFDDTPYQGHLRARPTVSPARRMTGEFPAGTFIVPLDQPCGEIIALLLEPESSDSLLAWNRMNGITTDGKVSEEWVLSNLASEMMDDPAVADAFRQRAAEDETFMEDRAARLRFFWERSPYPTSGVGDYPLVRALARPAVATETLVQGQIH